MERGSDYDPLPTQMAVQYLKDRRHILRERLEQLKDSLADVSLEVAHFSEAIDILERTQNDADKATTEHGDQEE